MKKYLNLRIFDAEAGTGDPGAGDGKGAAPAAKSQPAQPVAPDAQPSPAAPLRVPKPNGYGLTDEQLVEAVSAYRAAQKAKEPDVAAITRERDEALAKVAEYEQQGALAKKGVKPEFAKFVAYEIRELMKKDSKLDTFDKAAEKYLKDNPIYTGKAVATRMKATVAGTPGGYGPGTDAEKGAAKATINELLKRAALGRSS